MDVHLLDRLLADQADLVARWQLERAGWPEPLVSRRLRRMRKLHSGVHTTARGKLTREQELLAATLTTPDTFLTGSSAAGNFKIRRDPGLFITVVRPGTRGPRRQGPLLISYSATLTGNTSTHNGIPTTTVERTQIDLAAHDNPKLIAKTLRESIRLKHTTTDAMRKTLQTHSGVRGRAALDELVTFYEDLPIARCKFDAEAYGLHVFKERGIPIPRVNESWARAEADYCWPELNLIIEIDGPDFHKFKDVDARKTEAWRKAGYNVKRIPSGDVFDHPQQLVDLYLSGR